MEFPMGKRKSYNEEDENYERKNQIGKGKYIVKRVNQSCIKLVGSLKDNSSKIIYIHNK